MTDIKPEDLMGNLTQSSKRRYNVTITMIAAVTVEADGSVEAERLALEDVGISYDSNDVSISVIAIEPEDE